MKRAITTILSAAVLLFVGIMLFIAWSAVYGQTPELTPKETPESLKLQLAVEKQKSLQLQYQVIQAKIEPELAPLRVEFQKQEKAMAAESEAVKRQNGWGADVVLDQNPSSATFGTFIHKPVDVKKEAK